MNEDIDLTKILKDCSKGTKFYSTIDGEVEFVEIGCSNPDLVYFTDDHYEAFCYFKNGRHFKNRGECILFPSKEQRDTLFKAMTDAGFTFDFEEKKFKKVAAPIFHIGDTIAKQHNSDINKFGQFTITDITGGKYWYNDRIICDISEQDEWELITEKLELKDVEDETEIPFGAKDSELMEATYYIPKGFHAEIDDDKVVIKKGEKPTAWSEEDDAYKFFAILAVEDYYDEKNPLQKGIVDWLNSLKDRVGCEANCTTMWKPSDEQMEVLKEATNIAGYKYKSCLNSLYSDLKKLKG